MHPFLKKNEGKGELFFLARSRWFVVGWRLKTNGCTLRVRAVTMVISDVNNESASGKSRSALFFTSPDSRTILHTQNDRGNPIAAPGFRAIRSQV